MIWVTWENVGVDRIGCAWLIRRFVDPEAQFRFIRRDDAIPPGTEPFDIPGVRYSHHGGHCSFVALMQAYALDDVALQRIGRIIDEADTVQEVNLEPAAAGLDLICTGLRSISDSDQQAIERGSLLYDALYAVLATAR